MNRRKRARTVFAGSIWLALLPAVASAQSVIAGFARDTSKAVLPGVTVEAASPVLIEKVRTVGTPNKTEGSNDTKNLNRPAGIAVYPKTNEVFVADGYDNRRVI